MKLTINKSPFWCCDGGHATTAIFKQGEEYRTITAGDVMDAHKIGYEQGYRAAMEEVIKDFQEKLATPFGK